MVTRQYVIEFFPQFNYPDGVKESMLAVHDRVIAAGQEGAVEALLNRYAANSAAATPELLEAMKKISERSGVSEYAGALYLLIALSEPLRAHYAAHKIPEWVWQNSLSDLRNKAVECREVYGEWGTFVAEWLLGYYTLMRFGLGRLQFEVVTFDREVTVNGLKLSPSSKVINVHIPRTGTPLDYESVKKSYALAKDFFAKELGGAKTVFTCESWLLFPRHREILKAGSNIRRFIADYTLVSDGTYPDYSELWRLFDRKIEGDIEALPGDSSLRRAYKELMKRGEPSGYGFGVYVYN